MFGGSKATTSSVRGLSSKRISSSLAKHIIGRGPSLHGNYPVSSLLCPLRLLVRHVSGYGFPPPLPGHRTRSVPEPNQFSQVPDVSFGARCPLRPRKVQPLKFVESRLITGFTFFERLATFTLVTRLIRVHAVRITADTFASQGSARRIAPSHAQVATWRTNNYHDQFLSTDEKRQASPDAPKITKITKKMRADASQGEPGSVSSGVL